MKPPSHWRARLYAIPLLLERLKEVEPGWNTAKNSFYSLLLSYGTLRPEAVDLIGKQEGQQLFAKANEARQAADHPLTFTELTTWDTWFAMHPEKVAGKMVFTSSPQFPVTIDGTKQDIINAIRGGMTTKTDQAKRIRVMRLKAKAIVILQEQERSRRERDGLRGLNQSPLSGLGFLGTLAGLGSLAGLGKLPDDTSKRITDNDEAIKAVLDRQDKGRRYSKGDTLSFKDIIEQYNPGLSKEEIQAWVWYKRSIGVPMTGWNEYYLKLQKASVERLVITRPRPSNDQRIEIRDNHFRVIGSVAPNTVVGKATKGKLPYDKDTTYLIVRLAAGMIDNFPEGSLVYINETHVTVDKAPDEVDAQELKDLVKNGQLFYTNGRLVPYPIFAYGNMYDRELQLNADTATILEKYGETVLMTHKHVIAAAKPRLISIQNADARERPKILCISDFAKNFKLTVLREDAGLDLQKVADEAANKYSRRKAEQEMRQQMEDRRDANGLYVFSLLDAFRLWIVTLPKSDFEEVTAQEIVYYYIDGHVMGKSLSDEQKDTISKFGPQQGEKLFGRFLSECLTYEDQQKLDFSWNRIFNAYSSVPFHRVPVGFKCSAFFKRSLLQFTPAQREAIAFMEIAGSGVLAYDVGVGKTMSAIITLANSMFSGKCKRPIIAVPNPTYAKWLRELVGYEDKGSGEFVPGVLSYTGITINDWSNLGVAVVEDLKAERRKKMGGSKIAQALVDPFDQPVPENSITVVTFEGLMKIGYGPKVMDAMFNELAKILSQERHDDKSGRDFEKIQQGWRETLGLSNKGTLADIDTLGFDYLVIDEAHNFKNVFDQVPVDEDGKKRFKISAGKPSERGIKGFFLANFIQRTFGENVMLLTATPFSNSPLEIFSMLSLVGYKSLKAMGIQSLETFCETFVLQSLEYVNNYKGEIVLDNVVKSYNNRLVLQRLIHNHISYKTGEEAGVKRPVKINLPRTSAQQADGSQKRLPLDEQIVTFLRPTQAQRDNQKEIERLASTTGREALAAIGRALGQSLDNALSPYLYIGNADKMPTYTEYVENSPKIAYTMGCIQSVKAWHESRKEPVSGQVIYMNRGTEFFDLMKQYLLKEVGYKASVKFQGKSFDEVEFVTSAVSGDRKEAIKDAFLAGVVKVIIGTASIKEGIDLQTKGTVLYNLYPDWNPTDIKQLEGRIWRQGNEFGYVRVVMPLVQDSMDVFVFQKLEEKTARVNDIWYRADRGNVLDQESLDPLEIKFALFSDIEQLMKVKIDQIKKELQRKYVVVNANIEALSKFQASLSAYRNYQAICRNQVGLVLADFNKLLDMWEGAVRSQAWYPYVKIADLRYMPTELGKLRESLLEWVRSVQEFQASDMDDKVLIRLMDSGAKLILKTRGTAGGSLYYTIESYLSEFRQRVSEVRKTERTILTVRGMSADDDTNPLMEEYKAEKKAIETEASEINMPDYLDAVRDEMRVAKAKSGIAGSIPMERVADFEKLNYLLGYKAADVPTDAVGLPTEPKAEPKQEPGEEPKAEPKPADAEKAKRIKIFKLKAKAILILQEQERMRREREYAQQAA